MSKPNGRLGGICAIVVGILYVMLIIYAVLIPTGQRFDADQYFINYSQNPGLMNIAWIVMILTSMLSFAVVPAVSNLVRARNEEWVRMAELLAIAGYTISAASFLTLLARTPQLAQAYLNGSSAAQAAIVAVGFPQLDPYNLLVLGGPGIWFLVVNLLAFLHGDLPKLQAVLGVLIGIFLWVAPAAAIIQSDLLDQIAAGAGAVFAPIWYCWMGVCLLQEPS